MFCEHFFTSSSVSERRPLSCFVMAQPPPVRRPIRVRALYVLDNAQRQAEQAIPQLPLAQVPPPVAAPAGLAHVAAADNDADEAGQSAAPLLEVNRSSSFSFLLFNFVQSRTRSFLREVYSFSYFVSALGSYRATLSGCQLRVFC